MRTKPFILVGLYCIALFISCDFKTTIFGDFNSPNDPRTTEYADYTIEGGRRIVTLDVDGRAVLIDRENIQKANVEYDITGLGRKAKG